MEPFVLHGFSKEGYPLIFERSDTSKFGRFDFISADGKYIFWFSKDLTWKMGTKLYENKTLTGTMGTNTQGQDAYIRSQDRDRTHPHLVSSWLEYDGCDWLQNCEIRVIFASDPPKAMNKMRNTFSLSNVIQCASKLPEFLGLSKKPERNGNPDDDALSNSKRKTGAVVMVEDMEPSKKSRVLVGLPKIAFFP
jgi:hypothetical protein